MGAPSGDNTYRDRRAILPASTSSYGWGGNGGGKTGANGTNGSSGYYGESGGYGGSGATLKSGGSGGGSSFIEKTASNVKNIRGGAPIGDGLVVISW